MNISMMQSIKQQERIKMMNLTNTAYNNLISTIGKQQERIDELTISLEKEKNISAALQNELDMIDDFDITVDEALKPKRRLQ